MLIMDLAVPEPVPITQTSTVMVVSINTLYCKPSTTLLGLHTIFVLATTLGMTKRFMSTPIYLSRQLALVLDQILEA